MSFVVTAVESEVVIMHKRILDKHLVLPISLLICVIEVNRIILADLHDIGITEFVHVQPRRKAFLLIVRNLLSTVTHRLNAQLCLREIATAEHVHLLPTILEAPVRIKSDINFPIASGFSGD